MRKLKRIAAFGAGTALAIGLLVGIGTPAYAGTCSRQTVSNGVVTATCSGKTTFKWKCSTDLWNTVNTKTLNFKATGSTLTFRACNEGFPYDTSVS